MTRSTRKEWKEHYEKWQTSGKTQREYCEEEGIKYSTFKNKPGEYKIERDVGKFHPVKVIEATGSKTNITGEPYCKIAFSSGDEITISSETAMGRLKGLIKCLI